MGSRRISRSRTGAPWSRRCKACSAAAPIPTNLSLTDGPDQTQTPDQAPWQRGGRDRGARPHRPPADSRREEARNPRPAARGAPQPQADVEELGPARAAGRRLHVRVPAGHLPPQDGQPCVAAVPSTRCSRCCSTCCSATGSRRSCGVGGWPRRRPPQGDDRRAHVHGRAGAGELLLRAPPGRRCGGRGRPGRRGRAADRRARTRSGSRPSRRS